MTPTFLGLRSSSGIQDGLGIYPLHYNGGAKRERTNLFLVLSIGDVYSKKQLAVNRHKKRVRKCRYGPTPNNVPNCCQFKPSERIVCFWMSHLASKNCAATNLSIPIRSLLEEYCVMTRQNYYNNKSIVRKCENLFT